MKQNNTNIYTKKSHSSLWHFSSFLVVGFFCFSLSLSLYLFSFYALLDFLHYPLYNAFIETPFIEPLVASSLACLLPPLFLISTQYSFFERATRIFEIHGFLFLILFVVLASFCYYTLQQDDKMASIIYVFYFSGISRLLICLYLYISIRLSLSSQNLLPLHKLNIPHQQIPTILDKSLFFAQMFGIILMAVALFPPPFLGSAEFITSFSIFSLFFLYFYIIFQIRYTPYTLWRMPYIIVNTIILMHFGYYENLAWQIFLTLFYLYQCFVFYCLYKKSENWFL